MTVDSVQHNRLWERFLAALAARHALPARSAPGNYTPTEIARFADAKLETDLAVSFVQYYLERRYGGTSNRLSETEAEALILQIEALPMTSSSLPAPLAQRSDNQPHASVESRQTKLGVEPLKPEASEAALDESLPVGTEFLPQSQLAPKSATSALPPKPRQQQAAASAIAAKPKPQKSTKAKKSRRTAREMLTGLGRGLAKLLGGTALLFAVTVAYGLWDRWQSATHWKLQSAGGSTYISGMSEVSRASSKNPPRQKLAIGCDNGRDFMQIILPTDPQNGNRNTSERLYFRETMYSNGQYVGNYLIMQPAPSPEFQVISQIAESDYLQAAGNHHDNLDEARRLLSKPFSVSEFLSNFSRFKSVTLSLVRYDSQGQYWIPVMEPAGQEPYIFFGTGGLAKHLPELQEACHWNLAQKP